MVNLTRLDWSTSDSPSQYDGDDCGDDDDDDGGNDCDDDDHGDNDDDHVVSQHYGRVEW